MGQALRSGFRSCDIPAPPRQLWKIKKRILFVDDEQSVLDGLEDLLVRYRHRWEMVFVTGAAAALDQMRKKPFDVIVTDIRMPGMDGAALLRLVSEKYPGTVRIVLSGQ